MLLSRAWASRLNKKAASGKLAAFILGRAATFSPTHSVAVPLKNNCHSCLGGGVVGRAPISSATGPRSLCDARRDRWRGLNRAVLLAVV